MAILWEETVAETTYQVRNAGSTIRLYTNGILHTQYNPKSVVTGSVWDLLLMGGFLLPRENLHRACVLGVGGGAVLHQLHHFFPGIAVTGVELNGVHLKLAKKFFLSDHKSKLIRSDAIAWMKGYQGKEFDLIIEDLFAELDGEPDRVQEANYSWMNCLAGNLSSHGTLVLNFIDNESFHDACRIAKKLGFSSAFRLTTGNCFNIVAAFAKLTTDSRQLRNRLRQFSMLDTRRKSCQLKYAIRQVF